MKKLRPPYLLFLGQAQARIEAKTATGIAYWRPELCVGQLRLAGCKVDLGLPDLTIAQAAAKGVGTLIIGIAMPGGRLQEEWIPLMAEALCAGLDIASGLHSSMADHPLVRAALDSSGASLIEVRKSNLDFPVAGYRKRSGKRLLTVGTDCAIGKKQTALALEAAMKTAGWNADFRATGQTGIMIAGEGIPIDAVVADFVAGAAEALTPDNAENHWDVIEGQGSLFHPSYSCVSLGLLHGSQPDALVLCHEPSRTANSDFPDLPLPALEDCAELNLRMARMVNSAARLVGVSLNTRDLDEKAAMASLEDAAARLGVPAVDPVRTGVAQILAGLR